MNKLVVLLVFLLSNLCWAHGEIKDASQILKEKNDVFEFNENTFYYSVDSIFEADYKKRHRAKAIKDFHQSCQFIAEIVNKDMNKLAGTNLEHIKSFVKTMDHGRMGKQYYCYLHGFTQNDQLKNKKLSFKYYATPIFSGKTGKEKVLKDCSNLKYALRRDKIENSRIAIHDRVETERKRDGKQNGKDIYKCQVMWTSVLVEDIQQPACLSGETRKVFVSPAKLNDWSHLEFPYYTDTVPVRPLGYYDQKAYNHHRDKTGKVDHVSVANIVEEKQIPFVFQTQALLKHQDKYELIDAALVGNFVKSLKIDGKNPRFNDTEMICHIMGHNFCSGRKFRGDWAKYMNPEFWNQSQIINHEFSDIVTKAYKDGKNSHPKNEFASVNIDINLKSLWGDGAIDHLKGLVAAEHDITVVLTDDMWVAPDRSHLELTFQCK